ncbi:hypothetical protein O1611_g5994 [Lasiodiplodia mahajangana]|uniref:Uncharacterized protein n=1 Tax=Lasiodiplodia mahajangana TaxID=1108764 RepID=A0ACC2JJI2_9PEZI|nr:hypothetical protein O1611_g5994 [Lasiodiplodia mahajangana]
MVKQFVQNETAEEADWLIGEECLMPGIKGVALRSMKAPGTAYNDPRFGKDPQPDNFKDYKATDDDNGGVHLYSGIPNKAFYLSAVAFGGYSWEKAGKIWASTGPAQGGIEFLTNLGAVLSDPGVRNTGVVFLPPYAMGFYTMSRKRSIQRNLVEESGFTDDINTVDDNPVSRGVLDHIKDVLYQTQLNLWDEFKKTHRNATPPCLKTLKLFAEFMAASTPGNLDPSGRATVQAIQVHFREFVSGWNLQNPKPLISRDLTDSITNDLKTRIKNKFGLSELTRPKDYSTLENYTYMERQLWEDDPCGYVHEAYRVFISTKLKCHLSTPARLGETYEGSTRKNTGKGLCYKDKVMLVGWKEHWKCGCLPDKRRQATCEEVTNCCVPLMSCGNMEQAYSLLMQRAVDAHRKWVGESGHRRAVIAFSGPPGSGKSTIAVEVARRINAQFRRRLAICLGMDGFHYTRNYLDTLPNPIEAHTYRGAAWTFDADGVVALLKTLSDSKTAVEPVTILAPSFDHKLKDPVADAIRIEPEAEIVIMEGNWLLLDRDPWKQIPELVDDTWFVDVDLELALGRVARRHLAAGIEQTWEAAVARAKSNDLPNGNEVRMHLLEPNIRIRSVEVAGEGAQIMGLA